MQVVYIFLFFAAILLKGSFNRFMDFMPILIMCCGIIHYGLFRKNKLFVGYLLEKKGFSAFIFLIVLTLVAIIRSHNPYITTSSIAYDLVSIILFTIFIYLSFSYNFYRKGNFQLNAIFTIKTFLTSTAIISVLFFLWYISSPPQGGETGVIFKAIGLSVPPRKFPLSNVHPNVLGIFTGGVCVMLILSLFFIKYNRIQFLFFVIISFLCFLFLLFIDSRGTLFNVILSLTILIALHSFRLVRTLKLSPILIPGLPIIFLLFLPFLAGTELGSKLSRDKRDLATGNSRLLVWEYCFDEIAEVKPIHLIGYGENGHYKAGVSQKYGKFFGEDKENKYIVTHSNFLQMVFDQGYLGLLLMLIVFGITLTQLVKIYHHGNNFVLIPLGFIFYFILSGTTESIYGTYNRIYLYLILGALLLSNILYNEYSKHAITAKTE